MDRIVKKALKVDFHIHSFASHFKDQDKVKNGTIDKLPILIAKLDENNVNMLAITDHDNFDYEIYSKLKEEERNDNNSIEKVIPGIEFTVTIKNKILHIVTLFDDTDDEKIKSIQSNLYDSKNDKPLYDLQNSFSEEKYIEILRNIGTDTILIAHQKESLGSKNQRKHDANTLGMDELENLVFVDYFEAYEFKNKRNEIFNNYYIETQQKKLKGMRFITGSDCHNWNNYPEKSDNDFEFCYFKCLPSFRGIMMAITDSRRIKIGVSSFFSANAPIDNIELSIDNIDYNIALSKGINAIIGDNSIGKSLLIHKMTDYREINKDTKLKKAYEKYLEDNKIVIKTQIDSNNIRHFDRQGNIREIFSNNKTKSKDFINEYYPIEPNYDVVKATIEKKIDDFIKFLKNKKALNDEIKKLSNIRFELHEEAMSLQINEISIDFKDMIKKYDELIANISRAIMATNNLIENTLISKTEKNNLNKYQQYLSDLRNKYSKIKANITDEEKKVELINRELINLSTELSETKTEVQKNREVYNLKFTQLGETIKNLLKISQKPIVFDSTIEEINVEPTINENGDYRFICKSSVLKIDDEYIFDLIKYPLQAQYKKGLTDLNQINPVEFEENIKVGDQTPNDILEHYKETITKKIDSDFKIKYVINNSKDDDVTRELSNGANAQIYFDLLSSDKKKPGIYIIDQPEDDVSQPSIKRKLLKNFKTLSSNRQILLITHNPQFIVNLDVDNVIFIKKDDSTNKITIENGALEYVDDKTDILKIVADNIEGGIDSLKERYKKYEKNN